MRKMHQNTFGVFRGFFFYHSVVNNVAHVERSKAWRFRNVPHGPAGAAVTWSRCIGDHELSDVTQCYCHREPGRPVTALVPTQPITSCPPGRPVTAVVPTHPITSCPPEPPQPGMPLVV